MRRLLLCALAVALTACDGADLPPEVAAPTPADVIREPVWIRKPTPAEIATLRPKQAADFKLSAIANLWCVAKADGTAGDCQIDWQDPPGMGFGEAAMQAAPLFRVAPTDKLGPVEGRPVEVRVAWPKA